MSPLFDTYIGFDWHGKNLRSMADAERNVWFNLADLAAILNVSPEQYESFINKTDPEQYATGHSLGAETESEWLSLEQTKLLIFCFMAYYPAAQNFVERLHLEIYGRVKKNTDRAFIKKEPLLRLIPSNRHLKNEITLQDYALSVNQLMAFAFKDTGGSIGCAMVLLTAYNDADYQLKFSDLGNLDDALYSAALVVIRARVELRIEPHEVINNGSRLFEELWQWWHGFQVKQVGGVA